MRFTETKIMSWDEPQPPYDYDEDEEEIEDEPEPEDGLVDMWEAADAAAAAGDREYSAWAEEQAPWPVIPAPYLIRAHVVTLEPVQIPGVAKVAAHPETESITQPREVA
jgi:hypothetical protein